MIGEGLDDGGTRRPFLGGDAEMSPAITGNGKFMFRDEADGDGRGEGEAAILLLTLSLR